MQCELDRPQGRFEGESAAVSPADALSMFRRFLDGDTGFTREMTDLRAPVSPVLRFGLIAAAVIVLGLLLVSQLGD